jgi:hypothetical protein
MRQLGCRMNESDGSAGVKRRDELERAGEETSTVI